MFKFWLVPPGHVYYCSHFDVANNTITGTIPTNFGQLTALTYLGLDDNWISGTLPNNMFSAMTKLRFPSFPTLSASLASFVLYTTVVPVVVLSSLIHTRLPPHPVTVMPRLPVTSSH
jgi:hypothetical protein